MFVLQTVLLFLFSCNMQLHAHALMLKMKKEERSGRDGRS
jgi:hypothetical protein